jgi:hypothetical protein
MQFLSSIARLVVTGSLAECVLVSAIVARVPSARVRGSVLPDLALVWWCRCVWWVALCFFVQDKDYSVGPLLNV